MAYIAEWLNGLHQAKMTDLVVEATLDDLTKRDASILDPYLPLKTYSSRKFMAYVIDQMNTIASIVAYGAEPPVTSQGSIGKITAEMLKSSLAYVWDEEYQWHMKEAMDQAALKGTTVQLSPMPDGTVDGSNPDLASFIFGTVQMLARFQIDLLNHLTWQVLQFGKIDRTDPRTGVVTKISYLNPHGETATGTTQSGDLHFPDAITGTGGSTITPNNKWSEAATADGLQNLYNAVDRYIETNGFPPDYIFMSRRLLNKLMNQTSTKNAASSLTVTQVGTVSAAMLGAVLEARGIPPIKTFDEKFRNEFPDKTLQNVRFLNDNRFVFVKELMGIRAIGPTLENNGQSGIYVVTEEKSKTPPVDRTVTSATFCPIVADAKLLFSQQVD